MQKQESVVLVLAVVVFVALGAVIYVSQLPIVVSNPPPPNMGSMSCNYCIIDNNTQLTASVTNTCNVNLTVAWVYVDFTLQSMVPQSVVLNESQTQQFIIIGTNTTWDDGSQHLVRIVATDGVTCFTTIG
jgi:hypothetical protein